MKQILVPVSPGELLDKITILRIKSQRMKDAQKLANVRLELDALQNTWTAHTNANAASANAASANAADAAAATVEVDADINALMAVNERLWTIEDDIRDKERAQSFDAEFVRLARAVYVENDERAQIKRRINIKLGSDIVEEKSYAAYKS